MSKAYLMVITDKSTHSAFFDLEKLPHGANCNDVEEFTYQGVGLSQWISAHVDEVAMFTDKIRDGRFEPEVLNFISIVASLFENMPPANTFEDLLIGVTGEEVNIMRVKPDFASDAFQKFQKF